MRYRCCDKAYRRRRHTFIVCLMLLLVVAVLQNTIRSIPTYSRIPTIFVITPTVARLEQKADLTRLSNTLRLVPNLHWIIIEDAEIKTPMATNFLASCRISYTHLNSSTPQSSRQNKTRHRGVMQRNAGLDWIREQQFKSGVVYFGDDDNTYDIQVFEEMRYTKRVSIWPVGLAGGLVYETPFVKEGKVIGFRSSSKRRMFATDMAGFAVSVKLLNDKPSVQFRMTANAGFLEDDLLKQLGISLNDLEPKADECSKVLVWHTKTQRTNLGWEGRLKHELNKSNKTLEV
ncbi:galactosylgalactosylxylosylprotein 3-beta-glucuronosyltransferase 3-like [Mercenaria mercenaria]|uniref:galactosylgalactosylxylosylprotein 3-beta-glucuronosyltransferase 3-like n=1 Tax=Mercenaria mercenaria TaxID=6596 RepID=UPI001E1D3C60|nr:galactosylgalactosylxylosylprotein 3-beta-glucuronosyltransferase 3-like [Mercenaria mercenaria]